MENVTDYINAFEKKLEEREAILNNDSSDLKSVESLTKTLNELDLVLENLRKEYNERREEFEYDKKDPDLKEALDEKWTEIEEQLQQRALVQAEIEETINNYKKKFLSIRSGADANKELSELQNLYKERNKIIAKLEQIESRFKYDGPFDPYDTIPFSLEEADEVLETQEELKKIDGQILDLQVKINTLLFDTEKEEEIETSFLNTPLMNKDLKELSLEREKVLTKLKAMEEMDGKKVKIRFNGQRYEVCKEKRWQFKKMLYELAKIEKNISKLTHNELIISLDEELLGRMNEPQRITYLSSLLLQIENVPTGILVEYIDGKLIPLEYKDLYLEITDLLRESKKNSDTIDFSSPKNTMDYFWKFVESCTKEPLIDPVDITLGDKTYTVNRHDVELLKRCYQFCKERLEKMETKAAKLKQEQDNLKNSAQEQNSNFEKKGKTINVTVDNKEESINEEDLKQFAYNHATIKATEEMLHENITFDEEKYNAMSFDEQINYCKDLINQILLKNVKQPVNLKVDGKDIIIDASYADTMQKATEKLLNVSSLDVSIDENYVNHLNDDEKICYYRLLLHDITQRDIKEECTFTRNGQEYKFDKKYEKLFEKINNRIEFLEADKKKPLKIQKSRPAKFLAKIKRQLKKRVIQVGLGLSVMFCAGFGLGRLSNKTNVKETPSITQEDLDSALDKAVKNAVNIENLDDIVQKAVNEALEKERQTNQRVDDVVTKEEPVQEEALKMPLGETFTLNNDTPIFQNYDSTNGLKPTFKHDLYTTIAVQIQQPDGNIVEINYFDQDAKEIVAELLRNGAVILARRAVANEAMNDYLAHGIATGVFLEQTIVPSNLTTDLQDIINSTLSQGRGL